MLYQYKDTIAKHYGVDPRTIDARIKKGLVMEGQLDRGNKTKPMKVYVDCRQGVQEIGKAMTSNVEKK